MRMNGGGYRPDMRRRDLTRNRFSTCRESGENIASRSKLPAQVERQCEQPAVRLGVVEVILAAQPTDVLFDSRGGSRSDIDIVAASDECPIVVEGRDVSVEAARSEER